MMKTWTAADIVIRMTAFFGMGVSAFGAMMPTIDLSGDTAAQTVIAAGTEDLYQGHPSTVETADGRIIAVWCTPHGGGCGPAAESSDGGHTWTRIDGRFPAAFTNHVNCPSAYRLVGPDGRARLWVWSQCRMPAAADKSDHAIRFRHASAAMPSVMSEDEGRTWKEMPPLGPKFRCVMAFASVTRLADGAYMGLFHVGPNGEDRPPLKVYRSVTRDGGFTWSDPVLTAEAEGKNLCEPCVFRAPDGMELCALLRENTHKGNAMMIFSRDEGATWTKPVDTSWGLTGDRHQGVRLPDGRWLFCFRDMAVKSPTRGHFVAWIGNYDGLRRGSDVNAVRVKLLHNFAGCDCGYPGVTLLKDGTVLAVTYLKYRADDRNHSVVAVRFRPPACPAL